MSSKQEEVVELTLTTDGIEKTVRTTLEFQRFVDRAAAFVKDLMTVGQQCDATTSSCPIIVGVVGGAGSGKSTFCEILCARLSGAQWNLPAVTIGMDGYHFPNAYLEPHGLMSKKGSLETINSSAIRSDFSQFSRPFTKMQAQRLSVVAGDDVHTNTLSAGSVLTFPMYDRNLHDPVQDKITVDLDRHKVVLFEGLHLLSNDQDDWEAIRALFHGLIVLQVPVCVCEERVVQRKMLGGKSESSARSHWLRTDLKIHEQIHADIASLRETAADSIPPTLTYKYPSP